MKETALPLGVLLRGSESRAPLRVPGTALYMSGNPGITPPALVHNLRHNKVLHERVVIRNVRVDDVPHVVPEDRLTVDCLALNLWRIALRFGFMGEPNVPRELERIAGEPLPTFRRKAAFSSDANRSCCGPGAAGEPRSTAGCPARRATPLRFSAFPQIPWRNWPQGKRSLNPEECFE